MNIYLLIIAQFFLDRYTTRFDHFDSKVRCCGG